MQGIKLSILTPTYNRSALLLRAYKSLSIQTNKNFEWVIIDDGSLDDTFEQVEQFKIDASFPIKYFYKENGGKHTALNVGFQKCSGYLTLILDSDDYLDVRAVETLCDCIDPVEASDLCGVIGLRGNPRDGYCIGDRFPEEDLIADAVEVRYRQGVSGDKAEAFRTDILRNWRFPEINGEQFLGENYLWDQIEHERKALLINKVIYYTEYLDGGLTKLGRPLRLNNPIGGMLNSIVGMYEFMPFWHRVKNAILYNVYRIFAGYQMFEVNGSKQFELLIFATLIPSRLLFLMWKIRYFVFGRHES